jgi:superfamily II DNA or RNA helicase
MAEVATSGGKSLIISIVIFYTLKYINPDAKILIIVPSITLVTQFFDNIFEYNYGLNNIESSNQIESNSEIDTPCSIRVDEIMSDRPRKFGGSENPNIYIGTYQSLEKRDKKFFQQFHTVITDECHQAKAKTYLKILGYTVGHAYSRFGVSGTTPPTDSCEILTLQSVMGPTIGEVTATELKEKGIITPMEIRSIVMNHEDSEFDMRIRQIRKAGMGKEALDLEKDYIHISDKRMKFIKKIVSKFSNNSLILFYTIEYGQTLLRELSEEFKDFHFYYIDGDVNGKRREEIKKELEVNDDKIKILIASYGTLSTGVSIRNLHQLILADSFKSEQIIIQSIGRLLRLFDGKEKAIIYDLVDIFRSESPQNILYSHYIERQRFYRKRQYPYKEYKFNI